MIGECVLWYCVTKPQNQKQKQTPHNKTKPAPIPQKNRCIPQKCIIPRNMQQGETGETGHKTLLT